MMTSITLFNYNSLVFSSSSQKPNSTISYYSIGEGILILYP